VRLIWLVVGAWVLAEASFAAAAPPIFSWQEIAARRGQAAAARYRANLAVAKPEGVDRVAHVAGTTGRDSVLVILLQFPDQPADTLNHPPSAYDDLLFSVGTHPSGSMRDYYREVSRGAFDISGVVTRWYMAPRTYAEYTNGAGGFGGTPNNARQMALDALILADGEYDLSQFDRDNDGTLDALFIVHAGPGGEETADFNDIWSHQWLLPSPYTSPDGVVAYVYTTEPEEWAGMAPHTTAGALISVGVFCHEFGHTLGLPDLYDITASADAHEGVGEWDLMATGLYNHYFGAPLGTTPAHFSAWSLSRLGWVDPIWVTQDSSGVVVLPVETSDTTFRLWTNGEESNEYFLVENRQPIGFDAGLVRSSVESGNGPAHGLMIYHVDEGVLNQTDATHKLLDVEEAGGARIPSGFIGEQNLDAASGATVSQSVCGGPVNVVGNRGDAYDPWPGAGAQTNFTSESCPNTDSYCGNRPSQVAVRNISETLGAVTADFLTTGILLRREAPVADDPILAGTPNNANGLLETGETARIRVPITNLGSSTVGPLRARLVSTEPYLALGTDSLFYGTFAPGVTDSGTAILALVTSAPDPAGSQLTMQLNSAVNRVLADSFSVLIGVRTGICENFEGNAVRWFGLPTGCDNVNEWHREEGANSTGFGSWAWRLGPTGFSGSYAPTEDARLISPPIRLSGVSDTLRFQHRYDCEFVFDGLWVEISTNAAATWTPITPVGGYPTGDRYSGTKAVFTEAVFPLDGYSGIVQIAWHFQAQPPNGGQGWWIDDVTVNGDAPCAPVDVAVQRFEAVVAEAVTPPRVQLTWALPAGVEGTVSVERVTAPLPPTVVVRLPRFRGEGYFEDSGVSPGGIYEYSLRLERDGQADAVAGPIHVEVPARTPPTAPRVFALAPVRPNPFRPNATLSVSLDQDGPFVVRMYRADGSIVRTMRFASRPAGVHQISWDGRDDRGRAASAGLYFVELRFGNRTRVQKAVLLR